MEDKVRTNLTETECDDVDWIHLAQDTDHDENSNDPQKFLGIAEN